MLPLLVIPPIQPFHPRRIGLGFLSFPFLPVSCRLFGPTKKLKPLISNHLPPLFPKTWGVFVHFSNFALRFSARLIFQFRFSNPAFSSLVLPSSAHSCTPPSVHFRISRFQFRASV